MLHDSAEWTASSDQYYYWSETASQRAMGHDSVGPFDHMGHNSRLVKRVFCRATLCTAQPMPSSGCESVCLSVTLLSTFFVRIYAAAAEFICHQKNIHVYINVKDRRAANKE